MRIILGSSYIPIIPLLQGGRSLRQRFLGIGYSHKGFIEMLYRDITPTMENQMEKRKVNLMETGVIYVAGNYTQGLQIAQTLRTWIFRVGCRV